MPETPDDALRDTFRALAASSEAEIKIKGSRFIARAFPVRSEADVQETLAALRKDEYTATHHCSAYRLGPGGETFRHDDDGEPSGTAGVPILRRIDALDLTDTLVVVTRYYGGTKLGTGGLIRAYGEAAEEALAAATVREHVIRVPLRIRFEYPDTSPAMHTVSRFDAPIVATHYGEATALDLAVRVSEADDFEAAFVEALSGRGAAERNTFALDSEGA